MHNFQFFIVPFLFFCLTQPKEDKLKINKSTNQLLIKNGQGFDDKFSFRQPQINSSLDITNFHPLCTTNTPEEIVILTNLQVQNSFWRKVGVTRVGKKTYALEVPHIV